MAWTPTSPEELDNVIDLLDQRLHFGDRNFSAEVVRGLVRLLAHAYEVSEQTIYNILNEHRRAA